MKKRTARKMNTGLGLPHDKLQMAQIIKKLHSVGGYYWTRPDSSDCNVVVVVSRQRARRYGSRSSGQYVSAMQRQTSASSYASAGTLLSREFSNMFYALQPRTPHLNIELHTSTCHKSGKTAAAKRWCRRSSGSISIPCCLGTSTKSPIASTPSTSASSVWPSSTHTDPKAHITQAVPLQITVKKARRESAPVLPTSEPESQEESYTFRCHLDFLVTQSSVFRKYLGASANPALDITTSAPKIEDCAKLGTRACDSPRRPSTSPERKPTLRITVPGDIVSFSLLMEYLYMGDFDRLALAMESGEVRWEEVMLNAQHLGLDDDLKQKLGAWWGLRRKSRDANVRNSGPNVGTAQEAHQIRSDCSSLSSPKSVHASGRRELSMAERNSDLREPKRARPMNITAPRYSDIRTNISRRSSHRKGSSLSDLGQFPLPQPISTPASPAALSHTVSPPNARRAGMSAVAEWLGKTRSAPTAASLAYYCNSPALQSPRQHGA